MRTVAGWRAVRLALLVGAVFVLGVLCGERARAADGGPVGGTSSAVGVSATGAVTAGASTTGSVTVGPVTVGSVVSAGSDTAPDPDSNGPASVVEALTAPRPDAADPIRPLTGAVVRSVDERVVRPVGELAGTVADRLDEATPGELPALPTLPGLEQPAPLPELPHLPDAPGQPLPGPSTPGPQPGSSAPPPGAPVQDVPDEPKGPDGPSGAPGPVVGPVAHGPEPSRAVGATHDDHGHRPARDAVRDAVREAVRAGAPAPAPAPHAPAGRPDGTAGSRSAVDHGTPRHGDACAVTAHHRPPLRLVPGAAERAEATGTRDPYRDVPVSPA